MRILYCAAIIGALLAGLPCYAADTFQLDYQRTQDVERVTDITPPEEQNSLRSAFNLLLSHAYDDAAQAFQRLKEHTPEDPVPLYGLALAEQRRGNLDQALQYYRSVTEHRSASRELRQQAAINYAAAVPNRPESLQYLHRLYTSGDESTPLLTAIAHVCLQNNNLQMAQNFFQRALQANREQSSLYQYNLAVISDRMGQSSKAAHLYQMALNAPMANHLLRPEEQQSARARLAWLRRK